MAYHSCRNYHHVPPTNMTSRPKAPYEVTALDRALILAIHNARTIAQQLQEARESSLTTYRRTPGAWIDFNDENNDNTDILNPSRRIPGAWVDDNIDDLSTPRRPPTPYTSNNAEAQTTCPQRPPTAPTELARQRCKHLASRDAETRAHVKALEVELEEQIEEWTWNTRAGWRRRMRSASTSQAQRPPQAPRECADKERPLDEQYVGWVDMWDASQAESAREEVACRRQDREIRRSRRVVEGERPADEIYMGWVEVS